MPKAIALDAGLLVLLVVGLTKLEYISIHKRLRDYDIDDFGLLQKAIEVSDGIVVTPNALSEASNLLRQINDPAKTSIVEAFRRLIENTREVYIRSSDACARGEFIQLGLSDSALLEVGKSNLVILSADLDLCVAAEVAGYSTLNFNHIRDDFYNASAG